SRCLKRRGEGVARARSNAGPVRAGRFHPWARLAGAAATRHGRAGRGRRRAPGPAPGRGGTRADDPAREDALGRCAGPSPARGRGRHARREGAGPFAARRGGDRSGRRGHGPPCGRRPLPPGRAARRRYRSRPRGGGRGLDGGPDDQEPGADEGDAGPRRLGRSEGSVTEAGAREVHYRLRGEVAGSSRAYALHPGENWVGSVAGNTIVLPVRGVSRRHALLTLEPEGLTLEDMGSRNGTLVKGVRVQRTRLLAGDEIRVGPVRLRLEEVEPEDATIAIAVRSEGRGVAGLPADDTTATPVDEPGRVGLGLLQGLIDRVCASPEPDLTGLVALLSRALGASSACLFEMQRGEP